MIRSLLTCAAFSILLLADSALGAPMLHNDRFGSVVVTKGARNDGPAVVLFGDDSKEIVLARQTLTDNSSSLVEISAARYVEGIAREDAKESCAYLAGEVERLGQSAQSSLALKSYTPPWLIGVGPSASLVYAIYAQHPRAFGGVAAWGPQGGFDLALPLCPGDEIKPAFDATSHRVSFPTAALSGEAVLQGSSEPVKAWLDGVIAKFGKHVESGESSHGTEDLPLIELPADRRSSTTLAVILSGDGGWAAIDKELGAYFSQTGINVVGFDALRFFWSKKTPEQMTEAIVATLRKYLAAWHMQKIVLIGYSLGAEHVPFILSRLPSDLRSRVTLAVMLSPEKRTDFEIHIGGWLGFDAGDPLYPVAPEIGRVDGVPLACVYGEEDAEDSVCPEIDSHQFRVEKLQGGHHFGGDYRELGARIRGWMLEAETSHAAPSVP